MLFIFLLATFIFLLSQGILLLRIWYENCTMNGKNNIKKKKKMEIITCLEKEKEKEKSNHYKFITQDSSDHGNLFLNYHYHEIIATRRGLSVT